MLSSVPFHGKYLDVLCFSLVSCWYQSLTIWSSVLESLFKSINKQFIIISVSFIPFRTLILFDFNLYYLMHLNLCEYIIEDIITNLIMAMKRTTSIRTPTPPPVNKIHLFVLANWSSLDLSFVVTDLFFLGNTVNTMTYT